MILMLSAIFIAQLACFVLLGKISERTRRMREMLEAMRVYGIHDNDNPDAVL